MSEIERVVLGSALTARGRRGGKIESIIYLVSDVNAAKGSYVNQLGFGDAVDQ